MDAILLLIALIIAVVFGWGAFGGIIQLAFALFFWMLAGNIAGQLIRGEDYGIAGNIALGLFGGIFGTIILRMLGFGGIVAFPILGGIITGVLGAVLFIYIVRFTIDRNFGK